MRVWQKIYFFTLVLFLLILNTGLFLAADYIFFYNFTQEQKNTETGCYFLCQNLEHDFSMLQKNSRYQENVRERLLNGYKKYYKTQDITLTLEQAQAGQKPSLRSKVQDGGRNMMVFAEQNLNVPFDTYRIHYERRLTDFERTWRDLKRTFALISFGMSVLLCPLLYVFMHSILKPLGLLNESVDRIADGEYGQQAVLKKDTVWNRDEIYELSQNVNKMAKTIQYQIAALEEENEMKQTLMDNMAHELKTPLTSIYGYAEYLQYARTNPKEQYESLSYIMTESRRLSKLSETMLSMRIYEKENRQFVQVHLVTLAAHIEKILSHSLREKNLKLETDFELEAVCGDEAMFINLFRNLLENAIRASKTGGRILWNCRQEDDRTVFEVIDFGIGMEQKELAQITEAFYRVDKARSRKDGGVGLGLSVVDLIVKRMNGTMEFSSVPGEGTKVTVNLQLVNQNIKTL